MVPRGGRDTTQPSSGSPARWLAGEDDLKLLSSTTMVEGYPADYGRMQGICGISLDIRGLTRGLAGAGERRRRRVALLGLRYCTQT